jgi:hypothetical protein
MSGSSKKWRCRIPVATEEEKTSTATRERREIHAGAGKEVQRRHGGGDPAADHRNWYFFRSTAVWVAWNPCDG